MKSKETENQFTLEETQEAVLYSELAYYEEHSEGFKKVIKDIENHGGISKLKKIVPFYKTESQDPHELAGVVATTDDKIIVAYRGTSTINQVENDLKAYHAEMPLGKKYSVSVHAGCLNEYNSSNKDKERAIIEAKEGRQYNKFLFTGHSLGAGSATLAAMQHKFKNTNSNINVILFGSARFVSHNAAKSYEKSGLAQNTLNLQQKYDPVTMLPAKALDYTHVGHVVEIDTVMGDGVHLLSGPYNAMITGKYKAETHHAITKLGVVAKAEAYKPIEISQYKKYLMGISPVVFRSMMSNKKTAIISTIGMGVMAGIKSLSFSPTQSVDYNPKLFRKTNIQKLSH